MPKVKFVIKELRSAVHLLNFYETIMADSTNRGRESLLYTQGMGCTYCVQNTRYIRQYCSQVTVYVLAHLYSGSGTQ